MKIGSLLSCFFFVFLGLKAQEIPPITYYSPQHYKGENQNWAISQSKEDLLYFANNEGLLEFNGNKWSLYKAPNNTIIRSVKVVADRIYTGCYREFGYWQKNNFGKLAYTSLSKEIEKTLDDEEFWNILHVDNYILFQSKKRIYTYDLINDSFNIIDAQSSFPKLWYVDGQIYFHITNEGIYTLTSGKKVKVFNQNPLTEDEVITFYQDAESFVFLTRNQGFFRIKNDRVEKWQTSFDNVLEETSAYSAIRLKDNSLVIGTISNGLLILDDNGELAYHINEKNGLANNTILSLFGDSENTIWIGQDYGISSFNLNSPVRIYNDNYGDIGSVYACLVYKDNLYIGSNQGLFVKSINSNQNFNLIKGTKGQVWSLEMINGNLFCGHHSGTFLINGDQAKKILDVPGTWTIKKIENNQKLLIQGNYDGIYVLSNEENTWKLRNKIEGFNNSARFVEPLANKIFVNHEYKGLFELIVDDEYKRVKTSKVDTALRGHNSAITNYKNQILFAFHKGVYKYDYSESKFSKDSVLSTLYDKEEFTSGKMIVENNRLWFFTKNQLINVQTQSLGEAPVIHKFPFNADIRDAIAGYESIAPLSQSNTYILGKGTGFITLNLEREIYDNGSAKIAQIFKYSKLEPANKKEPLSLDEEAQLKKDENSLLFSLYTAQYPSHIKPQYQYRLLGQYPNWSNWSEQSEISFDNLPYGEYEFQARSKMGTKISNKPVSYKFTIETPWYASITMKIVYVILGVLGILSLNFFYRNRFRKKQDKVVKEANRKMQLEKVKNEQELIKLKNQQLNERYRMKSNELAASTMSLIRKNNVLKEVKNKLQDSYKDADELKQVYRLIDDSLSKNDDWELFKEAFNNADKLFLGKLKEAHPNLTPNEIRLCAYLRLNLTSKEIAPLFNISPRSVEVKRYRLRKKMGLVHDKNLVDYILSL